MKKFLIPVLAIVSLAALSSCHDNESDMPHMQQLQDSISANYATVGAIHINPEGRENLIVVLGDTHLYAAPADKKQQVATEIGMMAVRIFGKDSYLKTGKLVVTKDVHNTSNEPADGISASMNIDSMKKIVYPQGK